jgi:hypothetical protein
MRGYSQDWRNLLLYPFKAFYRIVNLLETENLLGRKLTEWKFPNDIASTQIKSYSVPSYLSNSQASVL